jgi:hypothetical protein
MPKQTDNPPNVITPFVGVGFQSSSHIPFIRSSLKAQVEGLRLLSSEMDSFIGVSEAEKQELRQKLLTNYAPQNPHLKVADLEAFVDGQVEALTEARHAFMRKFSAPFMNLGVPIILLSSALAEALINALVATGLIMTGRSDLFSMFDRMEIREKWRLGPKLFTDAVKLDYGSHLFCRLKDLVELRNAFTHSKIDITSSDESVRIKGTTDRKIMLNDHGRNALIDFSTLPDEILDLVVNSVDDPMVRFHLASSSFRFSV